MTPTSKLVVPLQLKILTNLLIHCEDLLGLILVTLRSEPFFLELMSNISRFSRDNTATFWHTEKLMIFC